MTPITPVDAGFSLKILGFHEHSWNKDLGSFVKIQEKHIRLGVFEVLIGDIQLAANEEGSKLRINFLSPGQLNSYGEDSVE